MLRTTDPNRAPRRTADPAVFVGLLRTTDQDCLELGCDWANWWPEPCGCGSKHIIRVCARCLVPDPDNPDCDGLADDEPGLGVA